MWDSMRDSVGNSVRISVGIYVGDSVEDSVWDSVWDSVGASVGHSVRDSVGYSVGAYIGSFFRLSEWQHVSHKPGVYPFQPAVDLWEMGLVPSFDGKMWRLHGGEDAKILWEGKLKAEK